ncbi:MAG: hypothetical protein K8R41_02520 [Bacteroidales bacterium]|nr:hypothetical protein [Bacteroidales bacterium]
MKNNFLKLNTFLIVFFLLISSCTTTDDPVIPGINCDFKYYNVAFAGGGGFNNCNTNRNHHYQIEIIGNNSIISIIANFSGINGKIHLLNSAFNSVSYSGTSTVAKIENLKIESGGIYYIIITTDIDDEGSYSLDICGDVYSAHRIQTVENSFNDQEWSPGGGFNSPNSWRNQHYSFNILEDNCFIDMIARSEGSNVRLYFLNSAGNTVTYSGISTNEQILGYNIENSGTYIISANTDENHNGTFDLSIFSRSGFIDNVIKINSTDFSPKTGEWNPGGGINNYNSPDNDRYTFEVLENTHIDIIGKSQGANCRIYLLDSGGNSITYTGINTYVEINSREITAGTYTISINADESDNGTYELFLHGKEGSVTELIPE